LWYNEKELFLISDEFAELKAN